MSFKRVKISKNIKRLKMPKDFVLTQKEPEQVNAVVYALGSFFLISWCEKHECSLSERFKK